MASMRARGSAMGRPAVREAEGSVRGRCGARAAHSVSVSGVQERRGVKWRMEDSQHPVEPDSQKSAINSRKFSYTE
jgi:hypothetical protein